MADRIGNLFITQPLYKIYQILKIDADIKAI